MIGFPAPFVSPSLSLSFSMMRLPLRTACAVLSVVAAISAQNPCMDPNLGTPLGLTDDSVSAPMPLGFTFNFPGGTAVTDIVVDSNGRILPNGGTTDLSESVNDLLSNTASICPLWDDLNPASTSADDVYFYTNNLDTAVITWKDMVQYGQTHQFTFQAVLKADHSITFTYDNRMQMQDALVGMSPGGGASDPGASDLSAAVTMPIDTGMDATCYELWTSGFDLGGTSTQFLDNGVGGYIVIGMTCGFATASEFGSSCDTTTVAIDWLPDGVGGYNVLPSSTTFDSNIGGTVAHTDDSIRTASLGFQFPMPDGTMVTDVDVDSNGRILQVGTDTADFTASISELTGQSGGLIAPFWTDWNVNAGGSIHFWTDGMTQANFTWNGVHQYQGTEPMTMQAQLRVDGSWTVIYVDTANFNVATTIQRPLLIGCTEGPLPTFVDPGETDLSAVSMTPIVTNGNPTQYEFFDQTIPEPYDLQSQLPPRLTYVTRPVLGQSFDLQLDNVPMGASSVQMLIGFFNLNLDLRILGVPCNLYSSINFPALPMQWSQGQSSASFSLTITPNTPSTVGLPLVMQAAMVNFGANPFNVELTNAVIAETGY